MDHFLLSTLGFLALGLFCYRFLCSKSVPPGPPSFPIVGSLFSLRQPLHRHFSELSKRYGPLIYLKIGTVPFLVVNDARTAEVVFKVHDVEFADRGRSEYFRLFSFDWKDMVFGPYGNLWKRMRKISVMHLFSNKMVNSSTDYRRSELQIAIQSILQCHKQGKPVRVRKIMGNYVSGSISLTLFGKKGLEAAVGILDQMSSQALNLNVGQLIPALDRFDLHGMNAKMQNKFLPPLKAIIDDIIEEHKLNKAQVGSDKFVPKDFTDVLISLEKEDALEDISIVALLADMIAAALETTISALEWMMAEMANNPQVVKKAQDELDKVIGKGRLVEESDLMSLPYIEAIVKETLRLHPPLPLALPHFSRKETTVNGYRIPAGCTMLINIWAIGRDQTYWSEPEVFRPERFLENQAGIIGQNFNVIPFSAGRRRCPGYPLALRSMGFLLASLLQVFNWNPDGKICLEEDKGTVTSHLASELLLVASPRIEEPCIIAL
ncbi:cytochrome P450 71A1-like [Selaginella moellendorffii]|uniref:cytochrome P450 71A1-like n=1 Tax=Selaginella moellendorffii TaxID=88036 RepID=UPI000D1C3CE5|nr:cytochrome P450 71A1-like [Selaginella moellendorffii]|eukprot:XP_024531689.1 cytochrome P450 71A1-like [Selaginella moellendorffii]